MSEQKKNENEVFLLNYTVDDGLIGGVCLNLSLLVNTTISRISGVGNITQSSNPSLNNSLNITGGYSVVNDTKILLVLKGKDANLAAQSSGFSMPEETFRIRIFLEKDWKSGSALYDYFKNGNWHGLEDQKVTLISKAEEDIKELERVLMERNAMITAV